MTEVTPSLENSRFQAFFEITVLRSPAIGQCFLFGSIGKKVKDMPRTYFQFIIVTQDFVALSFVSIAISVEYRESCVQFIALPLLI